VRTGWWQRKISSKHLFMHISDLCGSHLHLCFVTIVEYLSLVFLYIIYLAKWMRGSIGVMVFMKKMSSFFSVLEAEKSRSTALASGEGFKLHPYMAEGIMR
jgi:hypothetical protein